MDKEALTKAVSEVRVARETTLNELGMEGLERAGVSDEWRVRDVLAHFNGWDRWQLIQLRCAFTGETPTEAELTGGIAYPPNDSLQDDAMNAMFVAGTREHAAEEIVDHWREVSAMRAAWVAAASQAQLDALIGNNWTGGSPRILRLVAAVPSVSNPVPVWQVILDQVEHQRQHLQNVREWLGS